MSFWLDVSLRIMSQLFMFIISQHIEFIWTLSIPGLKKTWHFNPSWVLGDISVFSLPRYLSIEFECFSNLFISPCQTVALTQSCWSKWKSWRCGVSRQQRLGICKLHFNCSARQSRSCLSEPQPITTGHRPCGCRGTQQVHATNSIITPFCWRSSVPTYQTVEASMTSYQSFVFLMLFVNSVTVEPLI